MKDHIAEELNRSRLPQLNEQDRAAIIAELVNILHKALEFDFI